MEGNPVKLAQPLFFLAIILRYKSAKIIDERRVRNTKLLCYALTARQIDLKKITFARQH